METLYTDQNNIEAWLLEEVTDYHPPAEDILANVPAAFKSFVTPSVVPKTSKPANTTPAPVTPAATPLPAKKIPRIDLYQKLVDNYEAQRLRWIAFKSNARPDPNTAPPDTIDDYNRK